LARLHLDQKLTVGIVFVLSMFMAIMDITIVNVALPTIGRDFHVSPSSVDVVVTSFLVSLAVFIPASGWLGDRFGTKRILLTAIAIFTAASVLCGQAHNMTELVVYRILQGVGGGMLTPVGMAMLYRAYPPEERVRASRILIVPTALAPALGPVLGGVFVTQLSWRWVFYANLPIGIFAFVFGLLFLREHRESNPGRVDLAGFVLAGAGFALLMYSISEGPAHGWSTPLIAGTGIVGALLIGALVIVELRIREPLLDLRLLRDRLFGVASVVIFLAMAGFLATLYMVSLFYQDGLGLSALMSGLSTFPEALGVMLGAQIAGHLYPRIGPRRLMFGGLLVAGAMMCLLALGGYGTSLWYFRGVLLVMGIGIGNVFVPTQAAGFATIPPPSMGRASGFFNADRQLGGAVGVALLTTALATVGAAHMMDGVLHPDLSAYHLAFLVGAGLVFLGAVSALWIRDGDAAATMRPRRQPQPATEEVGAAASGTATAAVAVGRAEAVEAGDSGAATGPGEPAPVYVRD
jgi:EmrB/QacA subfamily drug resistance transporter